MRIRGTPRSVVIRRPAATLHVHCARTFLRRALGLLATARLADDAGLLIRPCSSIHTFGMRYTIDAVFLDARGTVLAVHPLLAPWRIATCRHAHAVLELAAGTAARTGLQPGERIAELQPWLALS